MARDRELEDLMSRNLVPASQVRQPAAKRGRPIPLLPPEPQGRQIPQLPTAPPAGFEPQPGPIQQLGQTAMQALQKVGERPIGETIGAVGRQLAAPAQTAAAGLQMGIQKAAEGIDRFGQQIVQGFQGDQLVAQPTAPSAPAQQQTVAQPQQEVSSAQPQQLDPNRLGVDVGVEDGVPSFSGAGVASPTSTTGLSDEEAAQFEVQRQADIQSNVARLNEATAAQRDLNAVKKAQAFMNLPEGQRGRMPDDVAKVLGKPTEPARGEGGGIGQPSFQDALADYASGRVGSQGYNMIRNLRMQQDDGFLSGARARNRVASLPSRQRGRALAQLAKAGAGGGGLPQVAGGGRSEGGPSVRDQLDIARFEREGASDTADAARRQEQQQFENELALSGERRAQAAADTKQQAAESEQRDAFREQLLNSGALPINPQAQQFVSNSALELADQFPGTDPMEVASMLQQHMGEIPEEGILSQDKLRVAKEQVAELIRQQTTGR